MRETYRSDQTGGGRAPPNAAQDECITHMRLLHIIPSYFRYLFSTWILSKVPGYGSAVFGLNIELVEGPRALWCGVCSGHGNHRGIFNPPISLAAHVHLRRCFPVLYLCRFFSTLNPAPSRLLRTCACVGVFIH